MKMAFLSWTNQPTVRFAVVTLLLLAIMGPMDWRLDVTEDQRHSLTQASLEMLSELSEGDDEVLVRCYLEGDFPARYRRLSEEIRSKLRTFSKRSGGKVRWDFIDVAESGDDKTIGETELALYEQGLRFTRIAFRENGVTAFQNVWPCAMVTVNGVDHPVQFLRSETMEPDEVMVQNAINQIEFTLGQAIRLGMRKRKPVVAFLQGHGCWDPAQTADFANDLAENAEVVDVRLDGRVDALCEKREGQPNRQPKFDALIVAGPDSTFSDRDKLLLDQYLMNGGRMLWLVDPLVTNRDSLAQQQFTMATTRDIHLFDLLFHYGARINRNMVLDAQCAPIMLGAGPMGDHRNMQMFNWYFAPVVLSQADAHPICANLDPVHFDFAGTIDIVNEKADREATVLLSTSPRAVVYNAPARVGTGVVELPPEHFDTGRREGYPLAVLLEGEFESFYALRLGTQMREDPEFAFRSQSKPGKVIVVSDADFIRNEVRSTAEGQVPMPLGFDRYSQRVVYDNKEWLLNAVSYLLDDAAQISLRSRTIAFRPLDDNRIRGKENGWAMMAIAIPMAWILLSGWGMSWTHGRRWTRSTKPVDKP